MLTFGHLSASYLISQAPVGGKRVTTKDILLILFFGYFLDLDLLLTQPILGLPASLHHFLPTHTPLFVFLFCFISYFFLKKYFSKKVLFLAFFAAFFHLVLDDLGYWLQLLHLQAESKTPQIFWLYPFDGRREMLLQQAHQGKINSDLLGVYLTKAPINVVLELVLLVWAIVTLKNQRKSSKVS